jgi:hypothetical protein
MPNAEAESAEANDLRSPCLKHMGFMLCVSSRREINVSNRQLLQVVSLAVLAFAGVVQADECDQLPQPSVTVTLLEAPVTLDIRYGFRALTNMGAELGPPGQAILGLTHGEAVVQFETQIPSYIDRTGRWECASPQIKVIYGFKPMTVYVANEFPAGSCAYREIHAHELRHVKTYQEHLAGIEKEINELLKKRFATGSPWRGPVGGTQSRLEEELDSRWLPYLKRRIEQVKMAQALIDTPQEYARVAASCNGEIANKIR